MDDVDRASWGIGLRAAHAVVAERRAAGDTSFRDASPRIRLLAEGRAGRSSWSRRTTLSRRKRVRRCPKVLAPAGRSPALLGTPQPGRRAHDALLRTLSNFATPSRLRSRQPPTAAQRMDRSGCAAALSGVSYVALRKIHFCAVRSAPLARQLGCTLAALAMSCKLRASWA